jgi:hypothetical protein
MQPERTGPSCVGGAAESSPNTNRRSDATSAGGAIGRAATTRGEVALLRSCLWEMGYRPIAIYNHDAPLEDAGKRPKGERWQARARQNPPVAAVATPQAIALNTGILCDGLRAVDIDIDDAAAAGEVRALALGVLGETLIRWRANSSRCLALYRAATGSPRKIKLVGKLGKIEVLGHGQQFVAFGTHPSGAVLNWHLSAPDSVPRDDLTALSEERIAGFLAAAAPMIGIMPATTIKPMRAAGIARVPDARSLAGFVRAVADAPEGDRNNILFWAACRLGEAIQDGNIGAGFGAGALAAAAVRAGLSIAEAERTIASGISRRCE